MTMLHANATTMPQCSILSFQESVPYGNEKRKGLFVIEVAMTTIGKLVLLERFFCGFCLLQILLKVLASYLDVHKSSR